jgi:predicted PurR-regulated permease PerM
MCMLSEQGKCRGTYWVPISPRRVKKQAECLGLPLFPGAVTVRRLMTRQQLFAAFFFAVLLFLFYQFYLMFSIFLIPLAWAALLAIVFYPLQLRLTHLLRGRNSVASFIFTTIVILVVIVPTVLLSLLLASESVAVYQSSKEFLSGNGLEEWMHRLQGWTPSKAAGIFGPILESWNIDIAGVAVKAANVVSSFLVSQATDFAKNLASFIVNFFLTTFALFFFFRDGARMVAFVRDLVPMEAEYKDLILTRLYETVAAVVQGTLVTSTTQGLLTGFGFFVLGVPFAVFLGCAAAFASLLPLGTALVWIPVAGYLGVTGSVTRAVILVIWGTLVVGMVDNLLRPLLIGGRAEIPTLLLFFGMLGGLQAYGFLGIFLAPAVIAILFAFLQIFREQYSTPAETGATGPD